MLVVTMACRETVVSRYASFDQARQAGAMARGWLPTLLPPTATDIREVHNLDSNEACGRFSVQRDALRSWASEHVDSGSREGRGRRIRPASWCHEIPDWARFERALLGATDSTMTVARLEGNGSTLVGLDVDHGRVYFWGPSH